MDLKKESSKHLKLNKKVILIIIRSQTLEGTLEIPVLFSLSVQKEPKCQRAKGPGQSPWLVTRRTCGKIYFSKLSSQGAPLHLPDSCWSGHRIKHVFLLLLWTAWLMSLRMHCHMGPGVRSGLLGAKQTTGPAGRLPSLLNRPLFHSTLSLTESLWTTKLGKVTGTHTPWTSNSETLRHRYYPSWRHNWGTSVKGFTFGGDCDKQHMLVYIHQGEPNGPPGQWCQVIQTH